MEISCTVFRLRYHFAIPPCCHTRGVTMIGKKILNWKRMQSIITLSALSTNFFGGSHDPVIELYYSEETHIPWIHVHSTWSAEVKPLYTSCMISTVLINLPSKHATLPLLVELPNHASILFDFLVYPDLQQHSSTNSTSNACPIKGNSWGQRSSRKKIIVRYLPNLSWQSLLYNWFSRRILL